MGYRKFRDSENRRWEVWLVLPNAAERRKKERRVALPSAAVQYTGPERRKSSRRLNPFHQTFSVPRGYEQGWLCFESEEGEKRRLAPSRKIGKEARPNVYRCGAGSQFAS